MIFLGLLLLICLYSGQFDFLRSMCSILW
jgi:hypothetical protein